MVKKKPFAYTKSKVFTGSLATVRESARVVVSRARPAESRSPASRSLLSYDPEADLWALVLNETPTGPVRTSEPTPGVEIDVDAQGHLIAVWVSGASATMSPRDLASLPKPPEDLLTLEEAAREAGLSSSTLRVQANVGRLVGEKRGRDWMIPRHALWTYLESRAPAGRRAKPRR